MSRPRALLRHDLWSNVPPTKEPVELTRAARAQGLRAIEELGRLGVVVRLEGGRAQFRMGVSVRGTGIQTVMPPAARRIVEKLGDVIEATLMERKL